MDVAILLGEPIRRPKNIPMFEKVCFPNMVTFLDDVFYIFKKCATGKMEVFEGSFYIDFYIPNMSHIKFNFMEIYHRTLPRNFPIILA